MSTLDSMEPRPWITSMLVLAVVLVWGCTAKTSPGPPWFWREAVPLDFGVGVSRVKVPHNSPEAVRRELLDPATLRVMAKSSGLSVKDLRTVVVAQDDALGCVQLYRTGWSERAFKILSDRLRDYVSARQYGHTKEFLLAAMTNSTAPALLTDADLKALVASQPLVPAAWLRRADSGTITHKAGEVASRTITTKRINGKEISTEAVQIRKVDEVCRWVAYTVSDGEIGSRYLVTFKADGTVDYVRESRCDAKEFDPKYLGIIKEVESEVDTAMRKDGSYGQFGSCHEFWRLKKEKLKGKGINWRSPVELNPGTLYD